MSNGDPIIIKGGGSIEILLSKDTFPQDAAMTEKHYCHDRHLTRVYVTDDSTDQVTSSYSIPEGGKFTIRIEHRLTDKGK